MTAPDDYRDLTVTATMTETTALLPCPCCEETRIGFGDTKYSPATVLEHGWSQNVFHFVNCPSCGLNNKGVVGHATKEDAAAACNRRATPAALSASPAGWRPIETAPKNERVIVSDGKIVGEACLLSYPNLEGWYYADDPNPAQTPPTHWMPLPPAPTAAPSPAPQEALTEALEETAKRIMWAIERNGPYNAGTADGRWHSMPKESRDRCLRAALAAARKEG